MQEASSTIVQYVKNSIAQHSFAEKHRHSRSLSEAYSSIRNSAAIDLLPTRTGLRGTARTNPGLLRNLI